MQQKLQQSHLDISCPKEKSSNYTLHVWISHLTENITTMTSGKYLCRLDGPQEFLRTVEISSLQVDQRFQNTGKRGPDVHYRFLVPSTPMDSEPFRWHVRSIPNACMTCIFLLLSLSPSTRGIGSDLLGGLMEWGFIYMDQLRKGRVDMMELCHCLGIIVSYIWASVRVEYLLTSWALRYIYGPS